VTDATDHPDVTMTGRLSTRDLPNGPGGSLRVPARGMCAVVGPSRSSGLLAPVGAGVEWGSGAATP